MSTPFRAVLLVGCAIVVAGCGSKESSEESGGDPGADPNPRAAVAPEHFVGPAWETRVTKLLTPAMLADVRPDTFCVSPDGRRFSWTVKRLGGHNVVIDGKNEPLTFSEPGKIEFSADGSSYAYAAGATDARQGASIIVHDGKPQACEGVFGLFAVARDAVAWRALGTRGGAGHIVVNESRFQYSHGGGGQKVALTSVGPEPRYAVAGRFAFASVGPRLRYAAADKDQVVVDGTPVFRTPQATVSQLQFSADGAAYGFLVRDTVNGRHEMFAVINGRPQKRMTEVWGLTLGADGKSWGCFGRDAKSGLYALVNGEILDLNGKVKAAPESLHFSPDGSRLAIRAGTALVMDDTVREIGRFNIAKSSERDIASPAFSPDSKRLAYVESTSSGYRVIVDEAQQGLWSQVSRVVWSPDSRRWAFLGQQTGGGPWVAYCNGESSEEFDAPGLDGEGRPILAFSPDGKALAYVAQRKLSWSVVVNGKPGQPFDQIGVAQTRVGFTPDGRFTYLARTQAGELVWARQAPPGTPADELPSVPEENEKSQWISLFNGKDLTNWGTANYNFKKNPASVQDGVLTLPPPGEFWLCTSGGGFQDYHLRLEARCGKSTYMVRPPTGFGRSGGEQPLEREEFGEGAVGFRGGFVLIRDVGTDHFTGTFSPIDRTQQPVMTTPKFYRVPGALLEPTTKPQEWCRIDLLVQGSHVQVQVNGRVVVDQAMSGSLAERGPIVLYSRQVGMHFRNIEIRQSVAPEDWGKAPPPAAVTPSPHNSQPKRPGNSKKDR